MTTKTTRSSKIVNRQSSIDIFKAGVAELADALDLGSSILTMWRFDSSRPHFFRKETPDASGQHVLRNGEMIMKNTLLYSILLVVLFSMTTAVAASDQDQWPTWRGPDMAGVSPNGKPPVKWSESENIKWKVELTGDGSDSSPIIWDDKIIFQIAVQTDKTGQAAPEPAPAPQEGRGRGRGRKKPTNVYKFNVVCLDRNTGKPIWEKTVTETIPHEGHHGDHGFASFSPVTDGKLIWASFGSRGLYCLDMDGDIKWSKELGQMQMRGTFGEGNSPALAGDNIVVLMDQEAGSYIAAFNKITGEPAWKTDRVEKTGWASPRVVDVSGQLQVIANGSTTVRAYDAKTGKEIWSCGGQTTNAIPTPVIGFDMVYCTSGFRSSALKAIKLGRTGDLTGTDSVVWEVDKATPYVPSPVLADDKLYVCAVNKGVISCYNAKTGKPYYVQQELEEMKGIYASGVFADGKVYLTGRQGTTYVLDNTDTFKVLSVNKLDDDIDCSPAIIGNELYLKGTKYLYCIADSK